MKIWICLCLLFLIHSIVILQDERYEVIYSSERGDNVTDSIYFLVCLQVKQIANYSNRTVIDLDQLSSDLYLYFENQFRNRGQDRYANTSNGSLSNQSKDHTEDHPNNHLNINSKLISLILEQTSSRNYPLISGLVCFTTDDFKQQNQVHRLLGPTSIRLVFKEDSFNAFYLDAGSGVQQLNVYSMPAPYSNCSQENAHRSDYRSLYACFHNRYRFLKYYYQGAESGLIRTDYDDRVEQVMENESKCFEKYLRNDCLLVYFVPSILPNEKNSDKNIRAHPALSAFGYWSQLIGLVCLLVGLSFIDLSNKLIQLANSKLANDRNEFIYFNSPNISWTRPISQLIAFLNGRKIRRKTIRNFLFFFRCAIFLTGLLFLLYLYIVMLLDYHKQLANPIKKQSITNLIKPEEMHLTVCIALDKILASKSNLSESTGNLYSSSSSSSTLSEIEEATESGLTNSLTAIFRSFQNKAFPVDWSLKKNETLFRRDGNQLSRCYPLIVRPTEPRFMQLISISKLVIKLKVPFRLYLLSKSESFNSFSSKSFYLSGKHSFLMKINKKLKSNRRCVEYERTYRHLNCMGRWDCLERCVHRNFIDRYGNITTGSTDHPLVINRAFFSRTEWTTASLTENKAAHEKILDGCEKKISNKPECSLTRFAAYFNIHEDALNEESWIDLQYDVTRTEEHEPSKYNILLDLLNITSILFGFTVFGSLQRVCAFVQTKLKMRENKLTVSPIIYLLCSLGFCWHIYHIFDLIINGELTYSQHYEVANEVRMPELIFCFEINKSRIDPNRRLTGHYLNEVTADLSVERIFKNITHLNKSNRVAEFRSVKSFFFANSKCFSLALNMTYPKKNFLFSIRNLVLKVDFRREFVEQWNAQKKRILFFTKTEGAMHFNKVLRLNYEGHQRSLSIVQMVYSLRYDWKFQLLKNPSALFFEESLINDSDAYLRRLFARFSAALNVASLNFFLTRKLFDYEIRDDLFEIYLDLVQNRSDHTSPLNLNYEREFSVYHVTKEASFDFKLMYRIFFFKKVVATSQDNYAKLIVSLLNTLSIWLDFVALDFGSHFKKVDWFLLFLHERLVRSKTALGRLQRRQLIQI